MWPVVRWYGNVALNATQIRIVVGGRVEVEVVEDLAVPGQFQGPLEAEILHACVEGPGDRVVSRVHLGRLLCRYGRSVMKH